MTAAAHSGLDLGSHFAGRWYDNGGYPCLMHVP